LLLGGTPPLEPVKPDWIIGKATFAVPELGELRLALPLIVPPPLTVSDVCRDQQIVSWIGSQSARLSLSPADMGFATGAQLSLSPF
jgi:hypothetical protein